MTLKVSPSEIRIVFSFNVALNTSRLVCVVNESPNRPTFSTFTFKSGGPLSSQALPLFVSLILAHLRMTSQDFAGADLAISNFGSTLISGDWTTILGSAVGDMGLGRESSETRKLSSGPE